MIISTHRIYDEAEITEEFLEALTIDNPAYWNRMRSGYPIEGEPEKIRLFKEINGKFYVPRNIPTAPLKAVKTLDRRVEGGKVSFKSKIILRENQAPAVEALVNNDNGILNASCGVGKTVMSLEAIARTGRPAIILVHKEFLMTQWMENIRKWLGVEPGFVQGNTFKWQGYPIIVAMLQTLYARRKQLPEGFTDYFGVVVSDEVHRVSAPTFSSVIELFPAKRRWGLSATLQRSDGLEFIFLFHIGPVLYQLLGTNLKPRVVSIGTHVQVQMDEFTMRNGNINSAKLTTHLATRPDRNERILHYLTDAAKNGRRIIVLSERVDQCTILKNEFDTRMMGYGIETRYYIGGMDAAQRKEAEENADVLFATTQMAKEALDIPALDTLFWATPQGSEITTEQAVGRIARLAEGKKNPIVIDFVDEKIGYCMALYKKRLRVYKKMELQLGGE